MANRTEWMEWSERTECGVKRAELRCDISERWDWSDIVDCRLDKRRLDRVSGVAMRLESRPVTRFSCSCSRGMTPEENEKGCTVLSDFRLGIASPI